MNRNLSKFSTLETGELRDICAMGNTPAYPDLLDYLEKFGEDEFVEEVRDYIQSIK